MERLQGLYVISVAARLLDLHPQTLRKYEREGFVEPPRTAGMLRLYSAEDIQRLRLIKRLVEDLGLNLAGVELALDLVRKLLHLREQLAQEKDSLALAQHLQEGVDEMLEMLGVSA